MTIRSSLLFTRLEKIPTIPTRLGPMPWYLIPVSMMIGTTIALMMDYPREYKIGLVIGAFSYFPFMGWLAFKASR